MVLDRQFISLSKDQFLEKANKIHNFKYDYSLSIYQGYKSKIIIICPKHGEFTQRSSDHFDGCGCIKCGIESRNNKKVLKLENFILRANKIHNNIYNYEFLVYKNAHTKIQIVCKKHGLFEQSPANHLSGKGCDKCGRINTIKFNSENPGGWSINAWKNKANKSKFFDSFKVYILKCWNDNEEFYKIGRTFCTIKRRFDSQKDLPYNWDVYKIYIGDCEEIFKLENRLKNLNKNSKYEPLLNFSGKKECFTKIKLLKT